jgi:hypothetical protein
MMQFDESQMNPRLCHVVLSQNLREGWMAHEDRIDGEIDWRYWTEGDERRKEGKRESKLSLPLHVVEVYVSHSVYDYRFVESVAEVETGYQIDC